MFPCGVEWIGRGRLNGLSTFAASVRPRSHKKLHHPPSLSHLNCHLQLLLALVSGLGGSLSANGLHPGHSETARLVQRPLVLTSKCIYSLQGKKTGKTYWLRSYRGCGQLAKSFIADQSHKGEGGSETIYGIQFFLKFASYCIRSAWFVVVTTLMVSHTHTRG